MRSIGLGTFLALILGACSTLPSTPENASVAGSAAGSTIYVVRRGWHIDIGFETAQLSSPLASLSATMRDGRYLVFGFGDRHYLMARNQGFPGMAAALWPGAGVMLITGLAVVPDEAFGPDQVIALRVTQLQLSAAQTFVWRSLSIPNSGLSPLAMGPYPGSLYYASPDRYSALHTCNTWAAQALQAAGLPVQSRGVVLAAQLWRQARDIAGASQVTSAAAPVPATGQR